MNLPSKPRDFFMVGTSNCLLNAGTSAALGKTVMPLARVTKWLLVKNVFKLLETTTV